MPRSIAAALVPLALLAPCAARGATPRADHVVVVVMENRAYDQVRSLPYAASLIAHGALFTRSHAITHPSQPNYLELFAGEMLGVFTDECPPPGVPLTAENLGHACEAAGLTWRAYCEGLPAAGSDTCSYDGDPGDGLYTRKHAPWTLFSNLTQSNARPWSDFAADLAARRLPALAFVLPNNCHNSHNLVPGCGPAEADAWMAEALPPVLRALGPRGVLILTWDEDDKKTDNHILTVFAGPLVRPGAVSAQPVTHLTVLRTICDLLGLKPIGAAAREAPIRGVWAVSPAPTR